jgi:hypothetical protein
MRLDWANCVKRFATPCCGGSENICDTVGTKERCPRRDAPWLFRSGNFLHLIVSESRALSTRSGRRLSICSPPTTGVQKVWTIRFVKTRLQSHGLIETNNGTGPD